MYKIWLIEQAVLSAMDTAPRPTAQQVIDFQAAANGSRGDTSKVMEVAGTTARINIAGVLTEAPDWLAAFFGGGNTTYGDILAAIDAVEADKSIKTVELFFNTPGGEALPVAEVADKIAAMKKPTTAIVQKAASAGYWLASQAGKVVALGKASMFGSIGAVASYRKPSMSAFEDVTSSNAPMKRPDPETEEGKAAIRTQLDQIEDLFITAVAVGRDTTIDTVHTTYGRGGMMLAQQALDAGMIDAIQASAGNVPNQSTKRGVKTMDLATLKAEHPGLYAEVLALGEQQGAAKEQDRVKFHLNMGTKCGAQDVAIKAALDGKAKDDGEMLAEYLSAGVNQRDLRAREQDEHDLKGNDPGAAGDEAKQKAQELKSAQAVFGQFGEVK